MIAFPLQWPAGWPREKGRMGQGHFYSTIYTLTFERARELLMRELRLLPAKGVVLSTNLPLRQDGFPYADSARKRMDDPGVAVYFTVKNKPMVMACDRYTDITANLRSLGLAIEALRQLERHGGGTMMERAFNGFSALPPPGKNEWRVVMGFTNETIVSVKAVEERYRALARERHPDAGGDNNLMAALNAARDAALNELKERA
jgi:hypothetical protein